MAMARKLKKGYFVRGEFVAEGSARDLELKAELKGTDEQSRTDLKRESAELQKLGEALSGLRIELLQSLGLPDKLLDALTEARRITDFEGKRRHMQFIGKLMRRLDVHEVQGLRNALDAQARGPAADTLLLHQCEQWRARLLDDDAAAGQWMAEHPGTDMQQLRALIRQARKDAVPEPAGAAPRHGRAYREMFQLLRDVMTARPEPQPEPPSFSTAREAT